MTINAHKGYNVYKTNGVHYILAKESDSFATIAAPFAVSANNLRKFNDLEPDAQPIDGEVIYIDKKRNKWEGNTKIHIVKEGETVYSLSQSYGIRMKSLKKRNKLKDTYILTAGQYIKLK